jgi:hypothetical protein
VLLEERRQRNEDFDLSLREKADLFIERKMKGNKFRVQRQSVERDNRFFVLNGAGLSRRPNLCVQSRVCRVRVLNAIKCPVVTSFVAGGGCFDRFLVVNKLFFYSDRGSNQRLAQIIAKFDEKMTGRSKNRRWESLNVELKRSEVKKKQTSR